MERRPVREVRVCNNPACDRCDEHLRPAQVVRKDGREVCPACHEELLTQEARPRAPRLPRPAAPSSGRRAP